MTEEYPIFSELLNSIRSTKDIEIPFIPLKRVIGQDEAVDLAGLAASQRRHLLLVGPPGIGKSMVAQALALNLLRPTHEIQIVHNPENPERPFVEVKDAEGVSQDRENQESAEGEIIDPKEAPATIAEKLGYKCVHCGVYSNYHDRTCSGCNKTKAAIPVSVGSSPFADLNNKDGGADSSPETATQERVITTRKRFGNEEVVMFERAGEGIKVLDQQALEKRREVERQSPRKILVPLDRKPFVFSTGASETELLGDVKHDPYGSHPELGIPPYERVVAGAIHEAHQGVLFIDELPNLGPIQRFILTAMQERRFPISGRNPQSAGASVRVDDVPCDFIFVGACNIQDLHEILSPLRSRIIGSGYEVLLNTSMPDNDENRCKLIQFIAQEVIMDGRIPHASPEAVQAIVEEAGSRALSSDGEKNALTLRLRDLGGLIRAAGDEAVRNDHELIQNDDIKNALKRSRPVEEQIREKYGSYFNAVASDVSASHRSTNPYYYWNSQEHKNTDRGYE